MPDFIDTLLMTTDHDLLSKSVQPRDEKHKTNTTLSKGSMITPPRTKAKQHDSMREVNEDRRISSRKRTWNHLEEVTFLFIMVSTSSLELSVRFLVPRKIIYEALTDTNAAQVGMDICFKWIVLHSVGLQNRSPSRWRVFSVQ